MKIYKTHFLLLSIIISLLSCKENPQNEAKTEAKNQSQLNTSQEPSDASGTGSNATMNSDDPLMVETPSHFYAPKGLKKLNLKEMYELGTRTDFKKDFPLKDTNGIAVDWALMQNPEKIMFMQMYTDSDGKIIEAVVFPVTDEVKAMITKTRMSSK